MREWRLQFSDSATAVFMLMGLPRPKYEGLIKSIEYNEEQQLSTKVVKAKLILEERRENLDKHHEEEEEAKALALRILIIEQNKMDQIKYKKKKKQEEKCSVFCI